MKFFYAKVFRETGFHNSSGSIIRCVFKFVACKKCFYVRIKFQSTNYRRNTFLFVRFSLLNFLLITFMKFSFALFIINIICITAYSQTEGYAASVNSKIYYRTFGAGKPILIINGGPGLNSDGFIELAKTLSKNNTTNPLCD
jgi:hypothetical protein